MRERAIIGAFLVALLAFAGIAIVAYAHVGRYGEHADMVRHTQQVLTDLEEGLGELRDIEIGQRGYLLSGNETFLEPYESSLRTARARFEELQTLTADNPAQQARLDGLMPIIEEKIAFSEQTVDIFAAGEQERARQLVAGGYGKALMDDIRRRVDEMEREERELLSMRSDRAESTAWRTTVLILFGNAFAFTLLTTGTILLGRELNRRTRLEHDLRFTEERAELREAAEAAKVRLEAVMQEMPLGVALADAPSGDIVLENGRMRSLLASRSPNENAGRGGSQHTRLRMLRSDGTPYPLEADPLSRALRGDLVRGEELQLTRDDGSALLAVVSLAPVREPGGRIMAAVALVDDAAELRRSEEERWRADRFRDLFLSALGHDLRNPLTVITAGAASLTRRASSPHERKIADRMAASADRMARMIDQLLDLTQARLGGGIPIERHRSDLGEIVRLTVERLEIVHPEREIQQSVSGDLAGAWDVPRIGTVVENLVLNALEHGRTDAPVRITARSNDDEVSLSVHNWGNPIPRELIPLIFDPFRRAAERKRMKSVGLGLGLYLALQIVRAHRGTLDVDSSAEAGTLFTVTLPRCIAPSTS